MQVRVAIVGIASALGGEVGSQCDVDPEIEAILGLDTHAPRPTPEKCTFRSTAGDVPLGPLFAERNIDLVVYLPPFPSGHSLEEPSLDPLLDRVLQGCRHADIHALVVASGPWLYAREPAGTGALVASTEGAALSLDHGPWAHADLRRERALALFARERPDTHVCVGRLAPVVGPRSRGLGWLLARQKRIVALADVDPVLQFLHVEDAGLALFKLLKASKSGVFNVCSEDGMTLSDVARCLKRPVARVSGGLVRALTGPGRYLGLHRLAGIDEALLPLLTNRVLLGNRKLKREVGYRFKYASDGALADHARLERLT